MNSSEEPIDHVPQSDAIEYKAEINVNQVEEVNFKHNSDEQYYESTTADEKVLDRAVNRKLDFVILPILAINFMLCGIDKTNIGNAATTSFAADAHLAVNDISDAVSLLSVTFIVFQPISTVIGRRVGIKYWIPAMMISWGTLCAAHAGIQNRETLIALRLLLGAAEAGFVPSCFYYLSTLYPKYHLGFIIGLFAGMYSIAGAFSGLIAYGIFQINSPVLKNWQMLFLIEGLITIAMAIVSLFVLPKDPNTAWFLSPVERVHAAYRMRVDISATVEYDDEGIIMNESRSVSMRDVKDVMTDWKKLLTVVFNILATLPVSAFGTFLPLIVKGMGYSGLSANLMSVTPFVAGAFGLFCIVYSSDHFKERSFHTIGAMGLTIVGLIVMSVSSDPILRYVFTHVCLAGAFVGGPLIVTWLAGNTPLRGPRSIIIGINGYSNLAGVIAGQLFQTKYAPSYQYPLTITMVLIAVGMVGFSCIRVLYMWTNRVRAKKISGWAAADYHEEKHSSIRRGDQKYTFIYSY